MGEKKFSTYLFPEPSSLYGLARLLDLGAGLDSYNVSPTAAIADTIAMYCDWSAVGEDIKKVLLAELRKAA
jgi:hypothetical protein